MSFGRKILITWLLSLAVFPMTSRSYGQESRSSTLENQIVRLHVSKKDIDESAPWQFEDIVQQTHLGVVLPGGLILTTAYAVANASLLEMQRFGSSQKYPLDIHFVDYEINLATLRPKEPVPGLLPIAMGGELKLDDTVDIYRARDTDQLIKIQANLQDVGVFNGVTSTYSALAYQFKTSQTGLGWSEPVFQHGKFVALCTGQDVQYVHAIPSVFAAHMLKDSLDERYRGFPTAGVVLTPLVSPDMRRHLGVASPGRGVRVAEIYPDSPFIDSLKVNDVIVEIDQIPISDKGYFNHPKWGKVYLKYLLNLHFGGDTLRLKVLRGGLPFEVSGKLNRYDSNRAPVIAYRFGQNIPHVIFGGLIFQEFSIDFLRQWGKEWREIAPIHLLYTLEYENRPRSQANERLIFLSRVLADPMNRGYGEIARTFVEKVNGQEVRSMQDLRTALGRPITVRGKRYAQIQLTRGAGEIILAYDDLADAHKRMAKTYEIPSPDSFFSLAAP